MINERYFLSLYSQGARAVLRYIERLEKRITDANARVTCSHQPRIDRLWREPARTRATPGRKSRRLVEQQQLNHQPMLRLRELEREVERGTAVVRDPHNSHLPPSLDPPRQKVSRTRSLRKQSGKRAGGQPGHRGATPKPSARPDHVITHAPEACPGCGSALDEADVISSGRRQVFDLPPVRPIVTGHRRETRCCPICGVATRAESPAGLRAPVRYGPGLLARAAYLNLYQLLPAARTAGALRDLFGRALSPATVERAGRLSSGTLVGSERRLKAAIRDSAVVGADGTGLRVAGGGGWVHVARTDALTRFAYDPRRGRDAMREVGILPQFRGTLVRDGYLPYTRFDQCRHSLRNAHLRREMVFVEETDPEQAVWTKPLAELLPGIKAAAEEARAAGHARLSEEARGAYLRRYDRLVKKADGLNPRPRGGGGGSGDSPQRKRPPLSPPRRLVNRLFAQT